MPKRTYEQDAVKGRRKHLQSISLFISGKAAATSLLGAIKIYRQNESGWSLHDCGNSIRIQEKIDGEKIVASQ